LREANLWTQVSTVPFTGDAGFTISWTNRSIEAGGWDTVSLFLRWGVASPVAPIIVILDFPDRISATNTSATVTGTFNHSAGERVNMVCIFDDDLNYIIVGEPEWMGSESPPGL
jgi:hypothetical protein